MVSIKDIGGGKEILKSQPPAGIRLIGNTPPKDELNIYIEENTLLEIDNYLASDTNLELGGVLVGNVYKDSAGDRFLWIKAYIHAEHTNASVSRLTFTHDTWEQIDRTLEDKFPGKMILGWYHSHPGHSVFLSGHDMFIQENFFNLDFMVAYVYDPTINDRGFFHWSNGKTVKSEGFYLVTDKDSSGTTSEEESEIRETIPQIPKPSMDEGYDDDFSFDDEGKSTKHRRPGDIILYVLIGINIVVSGFLSYKYNDLSKANNENEELRNDIGVLKENYGELNRKLEDYIIENEIKEQGNQNPLIVTKYMIKDGDSLKKIAQDFYKDESKFDLIVKHNNLKDEYDIIPGQEIEIPELSEVQ